MTSKSTSGSTTAPPAGSAASAGARKGARALVAVGAVMLLVLLVAAGLKSHRDLAAALARESSLDQQVQETEERVRVLTQRIGRLRDDPVLLERLAREEVGLIRPGDVIIVYPSSESTLANTPPPSSSPPPPSSP